MGLFLSKKEILEHNERRRHRRSYIAAFDSFRIICLILIIFATFGAPIPYFDEYVRPFLGFAYCFLFTIYGFCVLRDSADLGYHIKKTLKVFIIMLLVYALICAGYMWMMGGFPTLVDGQILTIKVNPLSLLTKRDLFNFVVLNYWPLPIGESIWYIQATLYALIFFWIIKRFKFFQRYDWIICVITFIIAILIGEFSGLINFSFLGITCINGNFLTRAIPYMILGRIIYRYTPILMDKVHFHPMLLVLGGFILAIVEVYVLYLLDKLVTTSHLIGFIPVCAGLCFFAVSKDRFRAFRKIEKYYPTILRGLYYTFNPLGYFFISFIGVVATNELYDSFAGVLSMMLIIVIILFSVAYKNISWQMQRYERRTSFIGREDEIDEFDI